MAKDQKVERQNEERLWSAYATMRGWYRWQLPALGKAGIFLTVVLYASVTSDILP